MYGKYSLQILELEAVDAFVQTFIQVPLCFLNPMPYMGIFLSKWLTKWIYFHEGWKIMSTTWLYDTQSIEL